MNHSASGMHEALHQNDEQLRLLVDAVTEYAIYTLDLDGRVASWNTGAERIKGYKAEEILGQPFGRFFPEESRARGIPESLLERAGKTGIAKTEGWRIRKDGTRFFAEAVISPIYGKDGKPRGFAKVTRDITDRKAMLELQASRNHLDIILNGVDNGITVQDTTGRLIFANAAAARSLGYGSAEALLQAPLLEIMSKYRILDENGNPFPMEKLPGRLALQGADTESVIMRYREVATGKESWSQVKAAPVRDEHGRITMAINFFQDITALKHKELEERSAKEQLRIILEGITDAISVQDPQGRLLYLNQACATMLGFASPEAVMELAGNPSMAETVRRQIVVLDEGGNTFPLEETPGRLALQGKTPSPVSLRYRMTADGRERWVVSGAKPVFDGNGELMLVVSILHDITQLKEAETNLRQSQKMEAIGKLAGGIAHDFNNLLTAINGYSEIILSRLSEGGGDLYEYMTEIRKAGERAASLTQQLLAFSRKQILAPKILDLNEVLGGLDSLLRRLIGEDIELLTVLRPKLDKVKADPGQVEQVILNLALNSRDAMTGGGKLTMETANVDLDESYVATHLDSKRGRHVMLAITDTGAGMDSHVRARLFEPFFTTKGVGKGTGLGLSTVFGIVKQSGGSINVYSEPGKGSTFKIYFPAVKDAAPDRPEVGEEGHGKEFSGDETVLIVEDEEGVRKLVERTLSDCGYLCLSAADAESALEISRVHPGQINLLITDVVLPRMNGKLLAERFLLMRPEIAILFMSGYTDNAIVHHGVLDEGTEFLNKPFSAQALKHRVRELLQRKM